MELRELLEEELVISLSSQMFQNFVTGNFIEELILEREDGVIQVVNNISRGLDVQRSRILKLHWNPMNHNPLLSGIPAP